MQEIFVWKFGGASVKNGEAIRNVCSILKNTQDANIVVVVSAIDKTTNKLEKVLKAFKNEVPHRYELIQKIENFHIAIAKDLLGKGHPILPEIKSIFNKMIDFLDKANWDNFDYNYDQVISKGEILSTKIIAAYLQFKNISCTWLSAPKVVRSDSEYRSSNVDWKITESRISKKVQPLFEDFRIVLTQGFIAANEKGHITTLGREGSDFSAAIFAYCLNASSVTIWKDVPGILTADPRLFKNVTKLDQISYKEAIEMTFYGAKVIHTKTIKPLQNKHIPLYVKPFDHPNESGTLIGNAGDEVYPPIVTVEYNQALLNISSKDFSFVAEHHISRIFQHLAEMRLQVNMIQNTAISFTLCVGDVPDRIEKFIEAIQKDFNVLVERNLELTTVRHYNKQVLKRLKKDKIIKLEVKLKNTAQMVMKRLSVLEPK